MLLLTAVPLSKPDPGFCFVLPCNTVVSCGLGVVSTVLHSFLELRTHEMGAAGVNARSWLGSSLSHTT